MTKYDRVLIESAKLWANESYCEKGKVGAVLADESRIVATGYNGTVHGKPNVCEFDIEVIEYFCDSCETHTENKKVCLNCGVPRSKTSVPFLRKKLKTSPYTVHAEQNVLMFCAKSGIPTDGLTMYITLSPCATCAKLMVQAGIKRVVYLKEYKDITGIQFLQDCGISCERYKYV